MQTIARQNNIAVELIRRRNFSNASQNFSVALNSLQKLLVEDQNNILSSSHESNTHSMACSSDCLDEGMLLPPVDENIDHLSIDTDLYIYDQGIMIPDALATSDRVIISAILIFNAALSHHLCAYQFPDYSTQYLSQARSLYAMAYQILGTPTRNSNVLFRVAVINNAAVIEGKLGNEMACRMFFDCLKSTWVLSVDQEQTSRLQHMRSFMWNILGNDHAAGAA